MELVGPDEPAALQLERFRDRIAAYMIKAVREAKQLSNWATPNIEYETLLSAFVQRVLDPSRSRAFFSDLQAFATRIALPGMVNALAQAVLKLTIPGVPDIYQGCECWDFSLVDPDNRRPVDFAARAAALAGLKTATDRAGGTAATTVAMLLDQWPNGKIKFYLQHRLLAERRRQPVLFNDGGYLPLAATGAHADHIVAFARAKDDAAIVVVVPRLVVSLGAGEGRMPIGDVWTDSAVVCPPALTGREWTDLLTGGVLVPHVDSGQELFKARDVFAGLPVAALVARTQ